MIPILVLFCFKVDLEMAEPSSRNPNPKLWSTTELQQPELRDDKNYCSLPYEDAKPCIFVHSKLPDTRHRIYHSNLLTRLAHRLVCIQVIWFISNHVVQLRLETLVVQKLFWFIIIIIYEQTFSFFVQHNFYKSYNSIFNFSLSFWKQYKIHWWLISAVEASLEFL